MISERTAGIDHSQCERCPGQHSSELTLSPPAPRNPVFAIALSPASTRCSPRWRMGRRRWRERGPTSATWRKALLKAAVTGELTADWRTAINPPAGNWRRPPKFAILTERRTQSEHAEPRNKGKAICRAVGARYRTRWLTLPGRMGVGERSISFRSVVQRRIPARDRRLLPHRYFGGQVPWIKVSSMSLPGNATTQRKYLRAGGSFPSTEAR